MNTARQRLSNRRETDTFRFDHEGQRYFGSVSRFDDGRAAEVLLDAGKPGSSIQAIARDGGVFASLALQYGCPLEVLRKAITRLDDGSAVGPLGKLLDLIDMSLIHIDSAQLPHRRAICGRTASGGTPTPQKRVSGKIPRLGVRFSETRAQRGFDHER
jgi:hypothetical protein